MLLISEYHITVLESFSALKQALSDLERCLKEDERQFSAWFQPPDALLLPNAMTICDQVMVFLKQLEYLDDQKPREILIGAGLVAGSEKTLEQVSVVNACKDHFKQAMLSLRRANITHSDQEDTLLDQHFESLLEKRPEPLATSLRKVGLARLHLKQCYRRIPIFFERPLKVSWTWANTRAITRITQDQARQQLQKQGDDFFIKAQLNKLNALSPNEPLAIVQELAPHLRANVLFCREKDQVKRVMVKGPMPIFYLATPGESFPEIRPPGLKKGKNKERAVRSDVKLEEQVFLPSIRVHRYNM